MAQFENVFVTVGSTYFTLLIQEVFSDNFLQLLKGKGCRKITAQIGKSYPVDVGKALEVYNIHVDQYEFKINGFLNDIRNADLIIGHAGAGTCLDIMECRKPSVVVVNELLLGNHQWELARHLDREGYIKCCTVDKLAEALINLNPKNFRSYNSAANKIEFANYFDNLLKGIATDA